MQFEKKQLTEATLSKTSSVLIKAFRVCIIVFLILIVTEHKPFILWI